MSNSTDIPPLRAMLEVKLTWSPLVTVQLSVLGVK